MTPAERHLIRGASHEVSDPEDRAESRGRHGAEEETDDSDRLTRSEQGRLEYERTHKILAQILTAPSRLYDIGGGTGIHAAALAAAGHTVTLLDPVPAHVATASALGGFEALEGDALALPFADDSADAALLAGPLHHLESRRDRVAALAEAARVVAPGGAVLAAGVSRYGAFSEYLAASEFALPLPSRQLDMLATGRLDPSEAGPSALRSAHFHTAAELAGELRAAGLTDVVVHGLEGPASSAMEHVLPDNDRLHHEMMQYARFASTDPRLVNLSGHLLAIGHTAAQPG